MQPELRAMLEAAATKNGRSLNAEITARLEDSFQPNNLLSLNWTELCKLLQMEAKKQGATITINIK
jgi:hypothetical protein